MADTPLRPVGVAKQAFRCQVEHAPAPPPQSRVPAVDLGDDESGEQALGKLPRGLDVLKLVQRKQRVLKDAWLTAIGHERPGMAKGLPLDDAEEQADDLENEIRKLSVKPADSGEVPF